MAYEFRPLAWYNSLYTCIDRVHFKLENAEAGVLIVKEA